MAKKKEKEPAAQEDVLTSAAKAIGSAAGKVAKAVGVEYTGEPRKSTKIPKLAKKNKSRLPRREKKAQKKKAAAATSRPKPS